MTNLQVRIKSGDVKPKKILRIYFDMGTNTPEQNISPMLDMITNEEKMNLIVYANMYEYLYDILQNDPKDAKREFLYLIQFSDKKSIFKKLKNHT